MIAGSMIAALKYLWEYVFLVVKTLVGRATVFASELVEIVPYGRRCGAILNQQVNPCHDILETPPNDPSQLHLNGNSLHYCSGHSHQRGCKSTKLGRVLSDFASGVIIGDSDAELEVFNFGYDVKELSMQVDKGINYAILSDKISKVVANLWATIERIQTQLEIDEESTVSTTSICQASKSVKGLKSQSFPKVSERRKLTSDGTFRSSVDVFTECNRESDAFDDAERNTTDAAATAATKHDQTQVKINEESTTSRIASQSVEEVNSQSLPGVSEEQLTSDDASKSLVGVFTECSADLAAFDDAEKIATAATKHAQACSHDSLPGAVPEPESSLPQLKAALDQGDCCCHFTANITFKHLTESSMPRKVASDLGLRQSDLDWDVNWTQDFISVWTCRQMKPHQRINHFPGSICLSNKDLLYWHLSRMNRLFPKEFDIFPKTWLLPQDEAIVRKYSKLNPGASFIVKPYDGGMGTGIRITRKVQKTYTYYVKYVCQLYIQRPFLLNGYKFDFRVYVLLTSLKPLRLYVHNEGLVRFSTLKYQRPNPSNYGKKFMHLTNTSVNVNSPNYEKQEPIASTRRISKVFQQLEAEKVNVRKIQEAMDDTIVKTIIACSSTLQHYYYLSFPSHSETISCFELMGFDIILDDNLKVYLLEVNVAPSFGNEAGTSHVESIKREVVTDTFNILNLMKHERTTVDNTGEYKNDITRRRTEWENSHVGNFRQIYPPKAPRDYEKFINASKRKLEPNLREQSGLKLTREQRKWLSQ